MGDNLRTFVLAEADDFRAYVIEPVAIDPVPRSPPRPQRPQHEWPGPADQAILAVHRAQQAHAWTANILDGFEHDLATAGMLVRVDRPPAMCFLDLTGYTRLTAERGDGAAAELVDRLRRLVSEPPCSTAGDPSSGWATASCSGSGTRARGGRGARDDRWCRSGGAAARPRGPPRRTGDFQDGDYYGQTVNVASRIAEYARPGEVLVSQDVVDAAGDVPIAFASIGPVELKGVSGVLALARRPASWQQAAHLVERWRQLDATRCPGRAAPAQSAGRSPLFDRDRVRRQGVVLSLAAFYLGLLLPRGRLLR